MSMNTTVAPHVGATISRDETVKGESFLSRLYKAIIAGREIQAQRVVRHYLANLSDAQLADLGFTAEEIRRTRTPSLPVSYWN